MATKGKEIAPGKEKRGTSPSPSNLHRTVDHANQKPSPKTQSSTRPNTPDKDQSTTLHRTVDPASQKPSSKSKSSTRPNTPDKDQSTKTSEKYVPNYLKSTISSSRGDQQPTLRHAVKKPGNDETQKQTCLLRRNSFDKPPSSPSRVQKPLGSMSFKERSSTSHSPSSVLHKPTTSKKPVVKTVYKAVKSQQPSPVPENKILDDPKVIHEALNAEKAPEQEVEEHEESLMSDVEEVSIKVSSGNELPPPETKVDNIIDDDLKTHEDDNENVQPCGISSVSEEQKKTPHSDENIMVTNTQGGEAVNVDHHVEEEIKKEEQEIENATQAEVQKKEPKVETENTNNESEGESSTNQTPDLEKIEEVKDEKQEKEEPKTEAKSKQVMKRQASARKENAPAYNDVIEETKNKLMQKRKNKVSALVGAFETVISMEETDV